MKKLSVFLLLIGILMTFSGCHRKHDMLPATCTEPATCSECGITEGEPLGHTEVPDEAVEPTCTEPGLTAGSHCEVCGEILVPQETIEPLGHDMLPATCTEPSTCSVCGMTEGEPLGHTEVPDEAVEPTCTEPGLTAGSHCEVCGEILVPQESVEPLGHDWEDASFSEPRICRVCGVSEGEPLGTDLFMNAINAPLLENRITDAAENDAGSASGDEGGHEDAAEKDIAFHKEIQISGFSHGLGEADDYINSSSLAITADFEDEQLKLLAETVFNGSKPINVLFTADKEGIGLTLPGITEEYYCVSYDALAELLAGYGQSYLPENMAVVPEEMMQPEELRDLSMKYAKILFSVVSLHNTKERRMDYTLLSLGKTQKCWVLEISPDKGDWRRMLRKLLRTASEDEELIDALITPAAKQMYAVDPGAAWLYDSPEEYAETIIEDFRNMLEDAWDDVDSTAEMLADYSFTIAYKSGRIYALSIHDEMDQGLYYESYGEEDEEREDVLVSRFYGEEDRLAYNTVRVLDGHVTGRLELDDSYMVLSYILDKDEAGKPFFDIQFSSPDLTCNLITENTDKGTQVKALFDTAEAEAELDVDVADTDERLKVPDKKKVLKTEEDLQEAVEEISEGIMQAELFGHDWIEADCTEPRTCWNCGETEGEPLGHDWEEATCTEPRTCWNCGETEGRELGHDWGKPDIGGIRTCRRCGETEAVSDGAAGVDTLKVKERKTIPFVHTESTGNVWENPSLGIRYEAADGEELLDAEDILLFNEVDEEFLNSVDMEEWLTNNEWTEMMAESDSGGVWLTVTDLPEVEDESAYLSGLVDQYLDQEESGNIYEEFESFGVDFMAEKTEVTVCGKSMPAIQGEGDLYGINVYALMTAFIENGKLLQIYKFSFDPITEDALAGFRSMEKDAGDDMPSFYESREIEKLA